ncbi:MAG: alpha/beta hydrolase [Helicobacteraceae bacterium]|jgi:pimeloyl-ACP methyl ester carboxylesterase|nr:alpha/beta hydrolase [Helicobacteraceae bacterium]
MALRNFTTPLGDYEISYIIEGDAALPKILILHGWGANKELMRRAFAPFLGDFRALYMDLPGFGASKNNRVLDTANYAAIVRAALAELDFTPIVIAGHSFGGKIATLLDPPILVLMSSAGIPKRKSFTVRAKIRLAKSPLGKIAKKLAAREFHEKIRTNDARGMSEVMYETLKKVVDEDFSEIFAARRGKTLIFWGKNDNQMPLYCGERAHALIAGSEFFAMSGDHFFFAARTKEIAEKIGAAMRDLGSGV